MKNLKYIIGVVFLLIGMMTFTSCLESGLDDLPAYEDANITNFYFEYRYGYTRSDGVVDTKYMRMTTVSQQINNDQSTIDLTISIPAVDGTFTEAERAKVNLSNLVGYCYLSNAAMIEPLEGAPKLGGIGNFSSPVKYKVTAADGKTVKNWTVTVKIQ